MLLTGFVLVGSSVITGKEKSNHVRVLMQQPHISTLPKENEPEPSRNKSLNNINKSLNQKSYRKDFLMICTIQMEPLITGKLRHILS